MCVERNIDARVCNNFGNGKVIRITYCECVFVALVIHHAMRTRRIFVCGLLRYIIFFPYFLISSTIFEKKMLLNTKCVFCFPLQVNLKHF